MNNYARLFLIAIHLVVVLALQTDMNSLHLSHFINHFLHLMERLVLLPITASPHSHLAEGRKLLAHDVEIYRIRLCT